jgi:hypothetical protein
VVLVAFVTVRWLSGEASDRSEWVWKTVFAMVYVVLATVLWRTVRRDRRATDD